MNSREEYKLAKIKSILAGAGCSKSIIDEVVSALENNQNDPAIVDRTAYRKALKRIAHTYLDIIFNEWQIIGGRTQVPANFMPYIIKIFDTLADDYIEEIELFATREEKYNNEKGEYII